MRSRIDPLRPEYRRWTYGPIYLELTKKGEYRGVIYENATDLDSVRRLRDLCSAVLLDMDPMEEARHGLR